MTRFKTKFIWFQNLETREVSIVDVTRDSSGTVYIAIGDKLEFKDGFPICHDVTDTFISSVSSWQQFITRHFPGSKYNKMQELFIY